MGSTERDRHKLQKLYAGRGPVERAKKDQLPAFVRGHVRAVEVVHTDETSAYTSMSEYAHESANTRQASMFAAGSTPTGPSRGRRCSSAATTGRFTR